MQGLNYDHNVPYKIVPGGDAWRGNIFLIGQVELMSLRDFRRVKDFILLLPVTYCTEAQVDLAA